jgi:hypothetical protein
VWRVLRIAQAVLERHPVGVDPPRHEEHLLVLDVHALDRADAVGEVEDLRLGEGRQGEEPPLQLTPGPLALPDHGRVEALLDDRPHREARREDLVAVVVADDQVGAVAGAELVDVVEQLVGGVAREHVGEARLDADAEQGQAVRRLPLAGPGELLVAELDADLLVRRAGVAHRQAHGHVEVVGVRGQGAGEDRHHEPRVDGVEDVGGAHLASQGRHCVRVGRVDLGGAEPLVARTPPARGRDRALGPLRVVVGHDPGLEEVALDRDPGRGVTDASGPDHQHPHRLWHVTPRLVARLSP